MGKLLIEMKDEGRITETIDLLPYILAAAVGARMMTQGEMDTYIAIASFAGWAMLKLVKVDGRWVIFWCGSLFSFTPLFKIRRSSDTIST